MEGIILIVLVERPRSHRPSVVQVAILFFYLNGCSISVTFNGLSRSGITNCTLWAISTYIPWMRLLQHGIFLLQSVKLWKSAPALIAWMTIWPMWGECSPMYIKGFSSHHSQDSVSHEHPKEILWLEALPSPTTIHYLSGFQKGPTSFLPIMPSFSIRICYGDTGIPLLEEPFRFVWKWRGK